MLLPRLLAAVVLSLIAVLVSAQTEAAREQPVATTVRQDAPPAACHVTLPSDGTFVPSSPLPNGQTADSWKHQFWFGSEKLWTVLPADGTWRGRIPQETVGFCL
jgi:hypothetical protein